MIMMIMTMMLMMMIMMVIMMMMTTKRVVNCAVKHFSYNLSRDDKTSKMRDD